MPRLAIHGGKPVRTKPFTRPSSIGQAEKRRVMEVLDSGVLSDFMGTWSDKFYGGRSVRCLEDAWCGYFGFKHAVSLNSATSALIAACGAAGISPGDEVIVSPYTMAASATAPIWYGGIPVFADIDACTFCITAESIEARVTPRTRAVIAVDLFGHPADYEAIQDVADRHNLVLIEDAAQALGASYNGRYCGGLAHIGIHSLNYHKHIHCGEGGMLATNDETIAERARLIRNHAEAVVGDKQAVDLTNMVGFNLRLGEIEAAIAYEQLKKLAAVVYARRENADYLSRCLDVPGITTPLEAVGCKSSWYLYACKYDAGVIGIPRDRFVAAVRAEGVPIVVGYVKPIYLEPMFQQRIAIGHDGYPFSLSDVTYQRGDCPTAERMHFDELVYTTAVHEGAIADDLDDFVDAVEKVMDNLEEIKESKNVISK